MRYTIALFSLLASIAFAGPAGRSLTLDINNQDQSFSNRVSRGEAFLWEINLVRNGAAYTNEILRGWIGYATSRTSSAWVQFDSTSATTNGRTVCDMTAVDSSGLSTNAADYPVTYAASVVLTNATGGIYRWRSGWLTIYHDGAVSGMSVAGASNVINWDTVSNLGTVPWTNGTANAITNGGVTLVAGTDIGLSSTILSNGVAITISNTGGGSTGGISAATATNIALAVVGPATNAAVIDATNRVAGVGYLLPVSTQNLVTATQLAGATNSAIIDATNRVAGVGYLLPASTQNLATVAQVTAATNAIDGAFIASKGGLTNVPTLAQVAAQGNSWTGGVEIGSATITNQLTVTGGVNVATLWGAVGIRRDPSSAYDLALTTNGLTMPGNGRIDFGAGNSRIVDGGSGFSLRFQVWDSVASVVERMRITTTGAVLVGTNVAGSGATRMHLAENGTNVFRAGASGVNCDVALNALGAGGNVITNGGATVNGASLTNGATIAEADTLATVAARGNSWTGDVTLATTGGNVGIGTNSPSATLDVNGGAILRGATTNVGPLFALGGGNVVTNGGTVAVAATNAQARVAIVETNTVTLAMTNGWVVSSHAAFVTNGGAVLVAGTDIGLSSTILSNGAAITISYTGGGSTGGISAATATGIAYAVVGEWATTGTASKATVATTVTGSQSNIIAAALQPADTNGWVVSSHAAFLTAETDPIWGAVSNTVRTGAAAGATALQPTGSGSGLTGITAAQVGAVSNTAAGIAAAGGVTNGQTGVTLAGSFTATGGNVLTNAAAFDASGAAAAATNAIDANFIASKGGVTNGAAGKTLTTFSFTMTNGTAQADGVINGSNGVYWTRGTTNYWITFP